MKRFWKPVLVAFAVSLAVQVVADLARAAEGDTLMVPRLSLQRVSVSVGADYSLTALDAVEDFKVWKAYAGLGYQIGPTLSLVAAARLPFTNDITLGKQPEYTVGARVLLMGGGKWRLW